TCHNTTWHGLDCL
ncbi:Protein of unknown function, partial [Gryllus bimaculatus]